MKRRCLRRSVQDVLHRWPRRAVGGIPAAVLGAALSHQGQLHTGSLWNAFVTKTKKLMKNLLRLIERARSDSVNDRGAVAARARDGTDPWFSRKGSLVPWVRVMKQHRNGTWYCTFTADEMLMFDPCSLESVEHFFLHSGKVLNLTTLEAMLVWYSVYQAWCVVHEEVPPGAAPQAIYRMSTAAPDYNTLSDAEKEDRSARWAYEITDFVFACPNKEQFGRKNYSSKVAEMIEEHIQCRPEKELLEIIGDESQARAKVISQAKGFQEGERFR